MKNRKPLKRKKYLPRLSQRIRSRKSNPAKRRFAKRRDPGYCAWIRTQPCLLWHFGAGRLCAGRIECAHVKSRGAGGDDVANTVPLCTRHHREQHSMGRRGFEYKYSLDLESKALYFGAKQPPKYERDRPDLFKQTEVRF